MVPQGSTSFHTLPDLCKNISVQVISNQHVLRSFTFSTFSHSGFSLSSMIVIGLVSQVRWMKASPPTCHMVDGLLDIVLCFWNISSSCHLVVPQILGRLLCGALGVPHQAALFIVHLLRKCYFSPSILPKFTCWQTSWLLGSHSLFVLYLHTSSYTTQCQRHPLQFLSTWPSSQTTGS